MGTARWEPKYWTKETASAWDNVKEAMRRDWEQTKADVHAGGKDLRQGVNDTLEQAGGEQKIPPRNVANDPADRPKMPWQHVEEPMKYGFAARKVHGDKKDWNGVERELANDWDDAKHAAGQKWDDVKRFVKRAYEDTNTRH